jgi:hypothetical protein
MTRTPIKSTMLKSVGHDPKTNTLEVEFADDGGVYQYKGVNAIKAGTMMADPSPSAFFRKNIKGVHPHTKVA